TIETFCASCSHAAAFFCASSRPHETLKAAKKKVNSHKEAPESQKCLDFIFIFPSQRRECAPPIRQRNYEKQLIHPGQYCSLAEVKKLPLDHEISCDCINSTGYISVSVFRVDRGCAAAGTDVHQGRHAYSSRALPDLPSSRRDWADVPHELPRGAPMGARESRKGGGARDAPMARRSRYWRVFQRSPAQRPRDPNDRPLGRCGCPGRESRGSSRASHLC